MRVERLIRRLGLLVLLVACGDLITLAIRTTGHDHAMGLIPLLDVNEEANLPTFVSGVLWIWAATTMAVLSSRQSSRGLQWAWTAWSAIAGYMAFDELFSVHEQWKAMGIRLAHALFGGVPYFAWILIGIIPVVGVALASLVVIRRLDPVLRRRLIIAGACFVVGALGLELVEGEWARAHGRDLVFHTIVLVEELLEMTAVLLSLRACLHELRRVDFRVQLG